jgi:DNA (cytosine-5)-methyltransferase 1
MTITFTGLFSGGGGLDLGFEMAGFKHLYSSDIDEWSVKTLQFNRPDWDITQADIYDLTEKDLPDSDVILAGFPCQGFSLGGNRQGNDQRNFLFQEVVRLVKVKQPRYVVLENVLNLRTMKEPTTGKTFVELISQGFEEIGYHVKHHIFRMSEYGVPQTRRRFVFIASKDKFPLDFCWPLPQSDTVASQFLADIAINPLIVLPNHDPQWGFASRVHSQTGESFDAAEKPVPCRFSRTGSDGHPIRSLDSPFPAIDTATIWGWAHGNVVAERKEKNRISGLYVRNAYTDLKLWRISASRLRCFTDREYARLQTFPDTWVFQGTNKRHIHQQIGNAVPVQFAYRLGKFIIDLSASQKSGQPMSKVLGQMAQLELQF